MSTTIEITTNPAVLTSGQVSNSGLRIARDGIKDDTILEQLELVVSSANAQSIISSDSANSAVTVRMSRDSLDRLIKTLSNMAISGNQIIASCITQLIEALSTTNDDSLVELNRGNIASIATTAHEIEEIQTQNIVTSSYGRMIMLPAAGPEWVSHANIENIDVVVNTLNNELGNDAGTTLLQEIMEAVPTDIGLAPNGTTVREGSISLDSQAAIRPVMQNHGQDTLNNLYLDSVDAFSSSDVAVTPLADMKTLLEISTQQDMVQVNPFVPIPLLVVKDEDGFVTDVSYDLEAAVTEEDLSALDMTKSLMDQDWTALLFTDNTRTVVSAAYSVLNCKVLSDSTVTKADGLIELYPSHKIVSGLTAFSVLSSLGKMWNAFKNHTGASNANIASLLGSGAVLAGNYIGGATGTTVSQLGNFVKQGAAAFQAGPIAMNLNAKKTILNYAPNLARLAQASTNQNTVSSTVTATAVERFGREFATAEANTTFALAAKASPNKIKVVKSKFAK